MSFLLDTMVVLWMASEPSRVRKHVRDLLRSTDETVYVSAVSSWEYRHKKLIKPQSLPIRFDDLTAMMPSDTLDLSYAASILAETLPLIHRDPFDRMLIALALHHDLTLITSDKNIRRYPVKTLW